MSKKCFKKILLVFFTIFIILSVIFYKPIEYYFIEQCHNPTGLVGSIMIKIWNRTFEDMSNWAIEKVDIAESDYILDVGCGGGQTVYNLAKKAKKRTSIWH
ncbi:SAM-dependent methyltransferase [Clostridium beijerinckii]|uniref:hypothetical protein n=1 Tax=Clostridium beijerinckii TaxID=1520 RepID=UPI0015703DCC|nr:hypothetical protein [Clostridium beijerinckii]NRZ73220.1 SAM-dependent methyltransferase [Clostridium beijerinckii]